MSIELPLFCQKCENSPPPFGRFSHAASARIAAARQRADGGGPRLTGCSTRRLRTWHRAACGNYTAFLRPEAVVLTASFVLYFSRPPGLPTISPSRVRRLRLPEQKNPRAGGQNAAGNKRKTFLFHTIGGLLHLAGHLPSPGRIGNHH